MTCPVHSSKAESMMAEMFPYLVKRGALPPVRKSPPYALTLEGRLNIKLRQIFGRGVHDQIVRTLQRRGVIPTSPEEREQMVRIALEIKIEQMTRTALQDALEAARHGRREIVDELQDIGANITLDDFDRSTRQHILARQTKFADETMEHLKKPILESLADSYQQGHGIDRAAEELEDVVEGIRGGRLRTAARTTIQGAQNEGRHITMLENDVRYDQWFTAEDSRVRNEPEANHVRMHGEVVEILERFSNGLLHPGDRTGPFEEWINCRCLSVPYFPKRGEVILTTPYRP